MRPSQALTRIVVLGITAGLLLTTPGQALGGLVSDPVVAAAAPSAAGGRTAAKAPAVAPAPAGPALAALAPGTVIHNPVFGRDEVVLADPARTALLIGDSQSDPANGWPRQALAALGYTVHFCGRGGTGFVASNAGVGNYIDALERGDWLLPAQAPSLIVVEGGGNDAAQGADDAGIRTNADRLLAALKSRFPTARIVMVGTLARAERAGGGRRAEVDSLVGSIASAHGLEFVSVGDWITRHNLELRLADSVHMDNEGRRILGNLLSRRFRELEIPDLNVPAGMAAGHRTGRQQG